MTSASAISRSREALSFKRPISTALVYEAFASRRLTAARYVSLIGTRAAAYINDQKVNYPDRPFFVYVPFNAPHQPSQALDNDIALFSGVSDPLRRTYYAMVYAMERNVGRILQALQGIEQDTIVI